MHSCYPAKVLFTMPKYSRKDSNILSNCLMRQERAKFAGDFSTS